MDYTRYAIYALPDASPLADFGAGWLGWDARSGSTTRPPDLPDLPAAWEDIIQTPKKYGFHGTIKPPFTLSEGHSFDALSAMFDAYGERAAPVSIAGLELAQLGRFLALVPSGDTQSLNALAAQIVRDFDMFRAPLTKAELARRRNSGLNARQDRLSVEWGYPYVMEEFRFHLTLTGKLPKAQATILRKLLDPIVTPLLPAPFTIDALCLMGERKDGFFERIRTVPLSRAH